MTKSHVRTYPSKKGISSNSVSLCSCVSKNQNDPTFYSGDIASLATSFQKRVFVSSFLRCLSSCKKNHPKIDSGDTGQRILQFDWLMVTPGVTCVHVFFCNFNSCLYCKLSYNTPTFTLCCSFTENIKSPSNFPFKRISYYLLQNI